jgi:hypothetical protein
MRRTAVRIKPANGFAKIFHWALVAGLPLLLFALVRWDIVFVAYLVVILSKWRMFAVRPRHWPANLRANAIDMIVGLSIVAFMSSASSVSQAWQLVWAVSYMGWLIFIKPRSTTFWVAVQAGIGQLMGLSAIYLLWGKSSLLLLVLASGGVCYLSARHFLSTFDEPLNSFLSYLWAFFAASLTWVLGHWLLYYANFMPQPVLLLCVLAYGLVTLYYLETNDRLSVVVRREIILAMSIVILAVILFSNWGDKTL